jgi:sulfiredoxin
MLRRRRRVVLNEISIEIEDSYVPMKRRNSLNPQRAEYSAEDILERGLATPVLVRRDAARFVSVEGLPRLEACKALGERTIKALMVQARRP